MANRRKIIKGLGTGTLWTTPIVQSVILPVHAQTSPACDAGVPATLNASTLDGCTYLIELETGEILEPTNITDFDIQLADGLPLLINFERGNAFTICQAGTPVILTCVQLR